MAKGYWIGRIDIADADAYAKYIAANAGPLAKFGARFIVRGGDFTSPEGSARQKQVVLEFDTIEAARACYDSAEYQAAIKLRVNVSEVDLVIVEGYDGPQPGES